MFCETKEDFNLIYGLSLEGIDPAVLTDKLISDIDWQPVYKVPRVKDKVKLKHVWLELYGDSMRLNKKVHEEIPINNELSVAFTRAFAHEYCKTTKEATNPKMYKITWALAGQALVKLCWKMGNLQQKMARFWRMVVADAIADSQPNPNETPHRHIVDNLIYLTITRPDLSYSVGLLSQFMQNPWNVHLDCVKRVLR